MQNLLCVPLVSGLCCGLSAGYSQILLSISVRHGNAGDVVACPMLENWPLFGQIIQLHSHLTEAMSKLPQFMFMCNKDVSPNIPLDSK